MHSHSRPTLAPIVLTLLLASCDGTPNEAADSLLAPEVETVAGTLRGERRTLDPDVMVFRGVPFAAPPVDEMRLAPPSPALHWEGVRDATRFGAGCWQAFTPDSSIYSRGEFERSEDCLFLNLWTAAETAAERRPVLVWFHGGSHLMGHAHSRVFDGSRLAAKGAVVVTANYRPD